MLWQIKEDLNNGKTFCAHILENNIVKTAIFSKAICRFNTIPIKVQWPFCKNKQADSKIHMELQGALNSQNNVEKQEQSWKTHMSQFWNLLQCFSNGNIGTDNYKVPQIGTGIRINMQMNRIKLRAPIYNSSLCSFNFWQGCQNLSTKKE